MASPFLFLHLAPTHSAIYFNLIIFCIYFFPILCPSLTLSGVLSLHLFRWARHMTSSIIFSEPVQNLKAPTFPTLLFPICNVPSKCFFVLTCFARPLFLILHSHISQGISILSTTDIPLSTVYELGKNTPYAILRTTCSEKINILWVTLVPANRPTSHLIEFWNISFRQLLIRIIVSRC